MMNRMINRNHCMPLSSKKVHCCLGYSTQPNRLLIERREVFQVQIPASWLPWFHFNTKQLFLFFQDPTHLVTKLRNRLLSKAAKLKMGRFDIALQHLVDVISNHSKIDHNLVLSDLYVKDRQNYSSCEKISSPSVLQILRMNSNTSATHCYLSVMRYIITAYINRNTSILERIHNAWKAVFICRCWYVWLRKRPSGQAHRKRHRRDFITEPAFFSIELNAHTLLFILLLVLDKQLPVESLNIYLFSS